MVPVIGYSVLLIFSQVWNSSLKGLHVYRKNARVLSSSGATEAINLFGRRHNTQVSARATNLAVPGSNLTSLTDKKKSTLHPGKYKAALLFDAA